MNSKIKSPMSEKDKQTVKLVGEVDPKDAFMIARRFASIEKSRLKKIKPSK
jgi:hypothetical protein